jgi:Protein of unknown function DUF262
VADTWQEGKTIKVSEVLDLFPRLGVPHFQRGRVWGKDSIAALLESLFYETPCGSFVFWDSGDNAAHGVPLHESTAAAGMDYLIIDGQQRIRSLYDAFTDAPLNEDEVTDSQPSDESSKRSKQWCINLAKAPGYDNLVKPRARDFPLFVYTANPKTASPRSPLRNNVLPIADVRTIPTWDAMDRYHEMVTFKLDPSNGDGARQAAERYLELRSRILCD